MRIKGRVFTLVLLLTFGTVASAQEAVMEGTPHPVQSPAAADPVPTVSAAADQVAGSLPAAASDDPVRIMTGTDTGTETAGAAAGQVGNGEEDLLLRLFLGIVYPFLVLVTLRLTRDFLRRWERRWTGSFLARLNSFSEKRGIAQYAEWNGRAVDTLRWISRVMIFVSVASLLSLAWFALFPQTRPLAREFAVGIVTPFLGLVGETAKGVFVLAYSAAVALSAVLLTRTLSRSHSKGIFARIPTEPGFLLFLRVLVWLAALFLVFFPYDGPSRVFAVGVMIITLLAALVALRPLVEETAVGMFVMMSLGIRRGSCISIDGQTYRVTKCGTVHAELEKEGTVFLVPYSRIVKSIVSIEKGRTDYDAE